MNKELLIDAAAVIESFCRWYPNDMTPHEKAIPARLQAVIDAPEQEPVAWITSYGNVARADIMKLGAPFDDREDYTIPLYTKPQTDDAFKPDWAGYRQGIEDGKAGAQFAPVELTDAEIVAIAIASRGAEPGKCGYILPVTFGRALLAAQRSKS